MNTGHTWLSSGINGMSGGYSIALKAMMAGSLASTRRI